MGVAHRFRVILPPRKKKRGSSACIPWLCCLRCGLVLLKNRESERAARAACAGLDD